MLNVKSFSLAVSLAILPVNVFAAPLDVSGWTTDTLTDSPALAPNWSVFNGGNSVVQTVNSRATVFHGDDLMGQDFVFTGQMSVRTASDDDFIGLVVGYDANEKSSATADYWVIDWRQWDTPGSDDEGLALSRVSGDFSETLLNEEMLWNHSGDVTEVVRGSNLGDTGWGDYRYSIFELSYLAGTLSLKIDGIPEFSQAADISSGSVGLYSLSQSDTEFVQLELTVFPQEESSLTPVPIPAAGWMLLVGVGACCGLRKKRKMSV